MQYDYIYIDVYIRSNGEKILRALNAGWEILSAVGTDNTIGYVLRRPKKVA